MPYYCTSNGHLTIPWGHKKDGGCCTVHPNSFHTTYIYVECTYFNGQEVHSYSNAVPTWVLDAAWVSRSSLKTFCSNLCSHLCHSTNITPLILPTKLHACSVHLETIFICTSPTSWPQLCSPAQNLAPNHITALLELLTPRGIQDMRGFQHARLVR